MTLGEALGELGAAQNATADEVRRAYLRLVKIRKPETDPEGFRRLRDAYEVVRAYLDARGPVAEGGPGAPPVPTRQPLEPSGPEVAPAPPAPDAVAGAAPVPGTPLAAEQDSELAELLEIQTLIATDSIGKAADRLEAVYERAATSPQALLPDPRVTIGLVLQLHLKGRPKSARSLDTSFRRWLKATDSEVKILAGPVAARWALCKELGDVPAGLSPRVRTAIARPRAPGGARRGAVPSGSLPGAGPDRRGPRRRAAPAQRRPQRPEARSGALAPAAADPQLSPVVGRRSYGDGVARRKLALQQLPRSRASLHGDRPGRALLGTDGQAAGEHRELEAGSRGGG